METALQRAAGSDTAAVAGWPADTDGLVRGIAAFVPLGAISTADIEISLRRLLPPYMMPSSVHRLADWPLNDNGKADYNRLKSFLRS